MRYGATLEIPLSGEIQPSRGIFVAARQSAAGVPGQGGEAFGREGCGGLGLSGGEST